MFWIRTGVRERTIALLAENVRSSSLRHGVRGVKLTSVCTGSILLGAAGLLRDRRATTHWAFYDELAAHGVTPVVERVVRDGKYATAAGVSAGIDLALSLALELAGEQVASGIQLGIEYDPAPPLRAGRPDQVSPMLRDALYTRMHRRDPEVQRALGQAH